MSYTPFKMKGFPMMQGTSPVKQEKSYGVLKSDKNKQEKSYGVLKSDKNKSESDKKMTKTVEPIERKGFTKTVGKIARKVKEEGKAKLVENKRKRTDREISIENNKEFNAYAEKQGLKPPQPKTDKEVASYTEFYKNKDNVNMLNKEQKKYFKNKKK